MALEAKTTADVLQRQLFARSERVKGIDFHPVEPWILTTLYSGMLGHPILSNYMLDLYFIVGVEADYGIQDMFISGAMRRRCVGQEGL